MKQLFTIILCAVLVLNLSAQKSDTTEIKVLKKNVVTVKEDADKVHVKVGNERGVEVITDDWGDTTHVRVGRRTFKVIEGNEGTYVKYDKEPKDKYWGRSFNAHWAGLEVGPNMIYKSDYSIYNGNPEYAQFGDFFDLNPGKSLTWNLNIAEFAFKNRKKTWAIVTGLGFSFNDYAFNDPVTIKKENDFGNKIIPVQIDESKSSVKKSKLHVNYITAPLLLEIKTPLRMGSSRLHISGGVIGGLYLGSHTKYKHHNKNKEKYKSNYHISQWKYDLTGRIHFGDISVFANWTMTPLINKDKGPEVYPVMIGISFINF